MLHIVLWNGGINSTTTLFELMDNVPSVDTIVAFHADITGVPYRGLQATHMDAMKRVALRTKQSESRRVLHASHSFTADSLSLGNEDVWLGALFIHVSSIQAREETAEPITVYWSTSKEDWKNANQEKLDKITQFMSPVADFQIVGSDVPKKERAQILGDSIRLTWSCETPRNGKPCYRCDKCVMKRRAMV